MGVGGQRHTLAVLPPGDTVSVVQEAGWAPEQDWVCAENLASIAIRTLKRKARS